MLSPILSQNTAPRPRSFRRPFLAALFGLLALTGCDRKPDGGPPGMGGPMGPVDVDVIAIAPTSVTLTQDLPGRISAFRVAEVRARVNGIVLKRHFTEGTDVTE